MAELISVIVTTFNREDALDAVLRSLSIQGDRDFEVIVADDGSGAATAKLIDAWKPKFAHRLEHVWHADQGFRAAEIRNRAILAARGSYCIFLDGDCIVRPDFVATHRRLAEPGWFVTGNRVLLSPALTTSVLREKQDPGNLGRRPLAWRALARRRQPVVGPSDSAARRSSATPEKRLARRALMQSRHMAVRSRSCRRLRCGLSRLGKRRL